MPEAKIPVQLSRNFSLWEAEKSLTAMRLGIDNTLPKRLMANATRVAQHILQYPRDRFGYPITPSSWYRCPELNKTIGGAGTSQHMLAEAVDFEIPQVDNFELFEWMISGGVPIFDQIILENHTRGDPNSGWIHASIVQGVENNRREVLVANNGVYRPHDNRVPSTPQPTVASPSGRTVRAPKPKPAAKSKTKAKPATKKPAAKRPARHKTGGKK